uniref:Uncharacterized protein n=1 Tax=Avena sativa TaxID=4498 RepID=A0ACD5WLS0_AVESA
MAGEMNRAKEILEAAVCKNCTEQWINAHLKPRKAVGHVEICVLVAAVFMIILAIGTPRRREGQSSIIRYGVEGMFVLSLPLITYTMGLINGQIIKNELYPVWALFLAILYGGTNAMSVQKLGDTKQSNSKLYWDSLSFMFYVGYVLAIFIKTRKHVAPVVCLIIAVTVLLSSKISERLYTIRLASKPSSENGIKRLAVYMKQEHQLSISYNPRTMQGYKYMVLIHKEQEGTRTTTTDAFDEESRAVTLEKIWCGNIGVLGSSSSSSHNNHPTSICHLKDVCLSFALFHLTVRRYFGYTCPESKLDKTRALVLEGLLRTEQDYERAFQVIETELAFLCDFFFTKYAFIMYGKEVRCCAVSVTITLLVIAAAAMSFSAVGEHVSVLHDLLVETSTRDVLVTKIALCTLSVFQLLEIWNYCVSDWAKVSLVCRYVSNPSLQGNAYVEKLLLLLGRHSRRLGNWRNNIGQYQVLDSFQSRDQAGKPAELSSEVKKAVARAIKNSISSGRVSNGGSTLMRHGITATATGEQQQQLCWACQIDDSFTLIHSILVWHVATCYCEISEAAAENDPDQVVANDLSRYCAYLVAFAPELLPGTPVESECTLDELLGEAKEAFHNHLLLPMEKYEKLRGLHNNAAAGGGVGSESRAAVAQLILLKGATLGKALESMENRWHLLADFWAEMIVYVAPSANVAGHVELLAHGGEFVTHVWALLMHAGILERHVAAADATLAMP